MLNLIQKQIQIAINLTPLAHYLTRFYTAAQGFFPPLPHLLPDSLQLMNSAQVLAHSLRSLRVGVLLADTRNYLIALARREVAQLVKVVTLVDMVLEGTFRRIQLIHGQWGVLVIRLSLLDQLFQLVEVLEESNGHLEQNLVLIYAS
jgi:hypothetical protein